MEEKINSIIGMSEELAGLPAGSYHSSCRKTEYNLCRGCANNLIMRELSIDYNTLSKYITSRDRATIYVMFEKHDENMENWSHYRCFYEALKAKLLSGNDSGEYLDRDTYDAILYRHGIQSVPRIIDEDDRMSITVCVGHFEGKLYRNLKDVPEALKILIEAFVEYKYKIVISKIDKYERIYKIT